MKKKLTAILIACLCVAEATSVVVPIAEPVTVMAATKAGTKQTKKKAPSLNKVYKAVKKAYGDSYTPSVKLSGDDIKNTYGIKSSWYSGAIAEVPMMSVHADELVIVKAKNASSKKKIKAALTSYQKYLKEDAHQYPANQVKIQASKIYVKGNYVCFFILGTIDNKTEEQGEAKALAAYKKQNEKAVNAIKKLYK